MTFDSLTLKLCGISAFLVRRFTEFGKSAEFLTI